MSLIKALQWRYAVKLFDRERKVAQEMVDRLVEAVRLTPTSLGLQPFRLLVVQDPIIKDALDGACHGQPQPGSSSHVFVFACCTDVDDEFVERYVEQLASERDMTPEAAGKFRSMVLGYLKATPAEAQPAWVEKQAYIGLGNLMTAAAIEGIDTCPMEGFDPAAVDRLLGLSEENLRSVLLCPIGYRDASDHHQTYAKVRVPTEDFATTI